ncbi:related to beta-lactamase class C and other penicillin binding proteins [Ramularia collo-cygni]|uniref:Related to beta-lactamase class C and other penicillin binding proteins n=1 Tax=Ramularia collo-cygni TaxID=112498 RepID=A0A2D3VC38_9PEZI|nr:related to beta-lactamase class C and other penicillin binding proteins [Ramularia collo-cygni]CZT19179.1 related to beta-lactamase class C and other penicillin binding proteins [Ramularia collo-cygni]
MSANLDQVLRNAQNKIRGPGGAIAIVQKGEVATHHVWGYADMDRAIPMRTNTQIPICSISKQMVCLVMVDLIRDPTPAAKAGGDVTAQLQTELETRLPQLAGKVTIQQLCNMSSGIRDYWAETVLWGSKPDGIFSATDDATAALNRTRSFHFEPGTEYSYSNVNFHILARIIENVAGQSLGQLLSQRVFIPAGMETASLCPNNAALPLPIVGYECTEQTGYFAAINRMEWSGDAGVVGSLEDMIAYEKWLHRSWSDPKSIYRTIAEPQSFKDGTPARYGFGLAHGETVGTKWLGHGGALRGFRLMRVHAPSEEVSVVVMLNHETDPSGAADLILKGALQLQEPTTASVSPSPEWMGSFLDEDTKLLVRVEAGSKDGEISISYDRARAPVKLTGIKTATSRAMEASIDGDVLHINRITDNRVLRAKRLAKRPDPETEDLSFTKDYLGEYHCSDSESSFRCTGEGTVLYGFFSGYLADGRNGPAHLMRYVAEDVWLLACPRGLDAQPPGDWTVCFHRDSNGAVCGATIGCWLARLNEYVRK